MTASRSSDLHAVVATVDDAPRADHVPAATTLADWLGLRVGCGEGVCGSCTVLVDDVPVRACLMLAVQADGCSIRTVASLALIEGTDPATPTPLQDAFAAHRAFQCGWCLPGLLVGTAAFLRDHPTADRGDLETHFIGHICRCLGGARMVDAALAVLAEPAR